MLRADSFSRKWLMNFSQPFEANTVVIITLSKEENLIFSQLIWPVI